MPPVRQVLALQRKSISLRYKTYWPTSIFSVIDRMTDALWENYRRDRALYIFGNGGSAALASHFCL